MLVLNNEYYISKLWWNMLKIWKRGCPNSGPSVDWKLQYIYCILQFSKSYIFCNIEVVVVFLTKVQIFFFKHTFCIKPHSTSGRVQLYPLCQWHLLVVLFSLRGFTPAKGLGLYRISLCVTFEWTLATPSPKVDFCLIFNAHSSLK